MQQDRGDSLANALIQDWTEKCYLCGIEENIRELDYYTLDDDKMVCQRCRHYIKIDARSVCQLSVVRTVSVLPAKEHLEPHKSSP